MCHLIWVDFSKSLCDGLPLVQFAEDSIEATSRCSSGRGSIIKSHRWGRRSWWRWWWRSSTSCCLRMGGSGEGLTLFYCLDRFLGWNTFGIPWNALRECLFDIFCEFLEDLVISVHPFGLLRIPANCVSSRQQQLKDFICRTCLCIPSKLDCPSIVLNPRIPRYVYVV